MTTITRPKHGQPAAEAEARGDTNATIALARAAEAIEELAAAENDLLFLRDAILRVGEGMQRLATTGMSPSERELVLAQLQLVARMVEKLSGRGDPVHGYPQDASSRKH